MESAKTSVPVFLIFFNRPDTFQQVFDAVKKARPEILFLACDGPREGREDDVKNVELCKKIAEDIDWNCQVYRNYSENNLGCGRRMYSGINWAFEKVDRLIVLEDDCVPSQDFFHFCEDVLERYKDDNRIFMVNAMNHLIKYDSVPYSYFFGEGCCWGWATWRRAWKAVDFDLGFLEDSYAMKCVERKYPYYRHVYKVGLEKEKEIKAGKKQSTWTYQAGVACALSSQMAIVPSVNLITNIGLTADSAHAVGNIRKLSKKTQAYFNAPIIPMAFPLKHPQYVVEDWNYSDLVQKKFKATLFSTIEGYARRIIFADKGELKQLAIKLVKRVIKKT